MEGTKEASETESRGAGTMKFVQLVKEVSPRKLDCLMGELVSQPYCLLAMLSFFPLCAHPLLDFCTLGYLDIRGKGGSKQSSWNAGR